VATPRFQAVLVASFGVVALLLAAIGLYGLISYQVQQRLGEIGVRVALGATRADIVRLVLVRAGLLSLSGVALGLLGALAVTRVASSLLFNVSTADPAIYAAVAAVLTIIALLASWVPTLRAVRVQPAVALRYE
jgi:putative ABC transport system permease protein